MMSSRKRYTKRVGRLDGELLDEVREVRRYPHIAYTEHHIAITLEQALTPIDCLHSPNFPDFHTIDLKAPLSSHLKARINPDDLINPLRNDRFKITRAGLKKMKEWSKKVKEKSMEELLEVLDTGKKDDPYPISSRPRHTILTLFGMLELPNHQNPQEKSSLKSLTQLYQPDSKFLPALKGEMGPLGINLNVDKILNLKPRMSASKAAEIMEGRKKMYEGLVKAEKRHGADMASAGIWLEWNERFEGEIRDQPRPIVPPLIFLFSSSSIQIKPIPLPSANHNLKEIPREKELVDQLATARLGYDTVAGNGDRTLMGDVQNMGILDSIEPRERPEMDAVDITVPSRSPLIAPPKRLSQVDWDTHVQLSRMEALMPLYSINHHIQTERYQPHHNHYPSEYKEWQAQVDTGETVGYWEEGGADSGWQGVAEGMYHEPEEMSTWEAGAQRYPEYMDHVGSAAHLQQANQRAQQDLQQPELIWAQSGRWQGGSQQRYSTSDLTSGDLSNVESIIDHVPRNTLPSVPPNQSVAPRPGSTFQNTVCQPPPIQPKSRRVTKRPYSPGLDALVAKRAKLANIHPDARPPPTEKLNMTDHFEVTTQLHDFVSTRISNSGKTHTIKPSILKPSGGIRLTSPEFATPLKSKSKPHWRTDPLLQNARWYTRVISRPINTTPKTSRHILATINFMQNVHLHTILKKEGFELLDEDRSNLCGVDVVLSPTTGLLFRPLSDLLHRSTELLEDIRMAVNHYVRVVVVFEVKSYGIKNIEGEVLPDDPDPHPPTIYTALQGFTETIAAMEKDVRQDKIGSVKLAFALNGAGEVGRVIRAMADHPEQEFTVDGDGTWLEDHPDLQDEERILEECYAINPYAGRAILSHFAPFTSYVRQWSMEEMLEKLRPIIGVVLAERSVRKVTGPPGMG